MADGRPVRVRLRYQRNSEGVTLAARRVVARSRTTANCQNRQQRRNRRGLLSPVTTPRAPHVDPPGRNPSVTLAMGRAAVLEYRKMAGDFEPSQTRVTEIAGVPSLPSMRCARGTDRGG